MDEFKQVYLIKTSLPPVKYARNPNTLKIETFDCMIDACTYAQKGLGLMSYQYSVTGVYQNMEGNLFHDSKGLLPLKEEKLRFIGAELSMGS